MGSLIPFRSRRKVSAAGITGLFFRQPAEWRERRKLELLRSGLSPELVRRLCSPSTAVSMTAEERRLLPLLPAGAPGRRP